MTLKLTEVQISELRRLYLDVDMAREDLIQSVTEYNEQIEDLFNEAQEHCDTYNNAVSEWNDYLGTLRDELEAQAPKDSTGAMLNEDEDNWVASFEYEDFDEMYFYDPAQLDEPEVENKLINLTDSPKGNKLTVV